VVLRRHKVTVRRSHVRYRFRTAAQTAASATLKLAVATVLIWGGYRGYRFWQESPYLRVQAVRVQADVPENFAARVRLKPGRHLFSFSAPDLERRLEGEFPELSDVRVRRRFDRGVDVRAEWRVPAARVADGEAWRGVDAGGTLFPLLASRQDLASLTILADAGEGRTVAPALEFLARLKALDEPWVERLLKLKPGPGGEATLYLSDPVAVRWGPMSADGDVLRRKSARLEAVLAQGPAGSLEYVRFVTEDRVAVKEAEPVRAEKPSGTAPGGVKDGKTGNRRQS
jgi:cell division septal protein FtsQ